MISFVSMIADSGDTDRVVECSRVKGANAVIYGVGSGMLLSANALMGSGDADRCLIGRALAEKGSREDIRVDIGGCSVVESDCRSVVLFVEARRELHRKLDIEMHLSDRSHLHQIRNILLTSPLTIIIAFGSIRPIL